MSIFQKPTSVYVLRPKRKFAWQRCFIWGGYFRFSCLEFGKIW